jgi:hypothetical protein
VKNAIKLFKLFARAKHALWMCQSTWSDITNSDLFSQDAETHIEHFLRLKCCTMLWAGPGFHEMSSFFLVCHK